MRRNSSYNLQEVEAITSKEVDPSLLKWRKIAVICSALALLLAVGLATTLGIFLVQNDCGPPPKHDLATSSYSGSSEAGSEVTYVCPRPLVFPNNNETFILRCTNGLEWETTEVPACSRQAKKQCSGLVKRDDFDLSLDIEDHISDLEIKLTLTGQLPNTVLVDLPSEEERKCSSADTDGNMGYLQKEISEQVGLGYVPLSLVGVVVPGKESQPKYTIMMTDSTVDAGAPYEIRVRSAGDVVALSLVQGSYVNITLHHIPDNSTVSPLSSATDYSLTKTITSKR